MANVALLCPSCRKPAGSNETQCMHCKHCLTTAACSRCRHANPVFAPLCEQCYADLRTATCPHCKARQLAASPVCTECRQPFYETSLVPTMAVSPPDPSARSMWRGLLYIAYLIVLLISAMTAFSAGTPDRTAALTFGILGGLFTPLTLFALVWVTVASRLILWKHYLLSLLAGGTLGIVGALVFYYLVPIVGITFGSFLVLPVIVGASEELAKAFALGGFTKHTRYHLAMHGLCFGMAAGAGFGGIENIGYIVRAYNEKGVSFLLTVVVLRSAVCLAHILWTGSLCAMLWREKRISIQFTQPVLNTFLCVALLHALWDYRLILMLARDSLQAQVYLAPANALFSISVLGTIVLFLFRLRDAIIGLQCETETQ